MKNSMKNEISSILSTVDCYSNLDDCYTELEDALKDQYDGYICIKKTDLIQEINKYFNTVEGEYFLEKNVINQGNSK